jgi:hypothetical protein
VDTKQPEHRPTGPIAEFYERNKNGLEWFDTATRTYFMRRNWTLRGPVPRGITVRHLGLDGKVPK